MATKKNKATMAEQAAEVEIIPREESRPMRGRGGRQNFPQFISGLDPEDVRVALGQVLQAYKMPRVQSDDELLDRIALYFDTCLERGSHPVIEELSLFLGYNSHNHLWMIESGNHKGFSPETKNIIKKAKYCVAALDAKFASEGKINFLAYCFRAKNFYGMSDKIEHVLSRDDDENVPSMDEISRAYMLDGGEQ